jgi:hypothetical protein
MTQYLYYAGACSIQNSMSVQSSSIRQDLNLRNAEDFTSITEMSAAMIIH